MCDHNFEKNYSLFYKFKGIRLPDRMCFSGEHPQEAVDFCINELKRLNISYSITAASCDCGCLRYPGTPEQAAYFLKHRFDLCFVEQGGKWDWEYKHYIPTFFRVFHEGQFESWNERCFDCYLKYYAEHHPIEGLGCGEERGPEKLFEEGFFGSYQVKK